MDDWNVRQVLGLLEGGNGQFKEYCRRQGVEGEIEDVYGRKAVRYYREVSRYIYIYILLCCSIFVFVFFVFFSNDPCEPITCVCVLTEP